MPFPPVFYGRTRDQIVPLRPIDQHTVHRFETVHCFTWNIRGGEKVFRGQLAALAFFFTQANSRASAAGVTPSMRPA